MVKSVMIDPAREDAIRKLYQAEIKKVTHGNRDESIASLKLQLSRLKEEESRLGRLVITSRISEDAYDQLRKEWQEQLLKIELSIAELEQKKYLDR